ncbi:MAG: hypothetical protein GY861_18835 [bacterium]|nr:hypothetical protein [bacterium]
MSTRSIIVVKDENSVTRLYKHCDGYPTGNLPVIQKALAKSLEQQAKSLKRHKEYGSKITVDQMVGHIIGEATSIYGMGAFIEKKYQSEFKPIHLGNQFDLEWIYIIDIKEKTVSIYGGESTGDSPQKTYKKGVVDPFVYVERSIADEYQDEYRKETKDCLNNLRSIGFKVKGE